MTFLELQNQLVQTKKARKGTSNRRDYYSDVNNNFEFDDLTYRKALSVANKVVRHYYDLGKIDRNEKISVIFGDNKKTNKAKSKENEDLKIENQKLQAELNDLKKQLEEFKNKFRNGGRKGYNNTMINQVKQAREQGESWRGLSARLGISTTTAQKLYKMR